MTLKVDLSPINNFQYSQVPNFQFSFLLLDENLRALHSPFMCKDYLQDIFWSEHTKNSADIWGIHWRPGMFDISAQKYKLALLGGQEVLANHAENLQNFINAFESAQKFPLSVVETTDNDRILVVTFSKRWTKNGPILSTLTTLIRLGQLYEGGDIIEYLQNLYKQTTGEIPRTYKDYMRVEILRLTRTLPKLAAFLSGIKVKGSWKNSTDVNSAHDTGIYEYSKYPTKEIL